MNMAKWWTLALITTLVLLLLIAVPINYKKGNKETLLRPMFDSYIEKFNKSYKGNEAEYETRFRHFMASVEEIEALNEASVGPDHMKARYGLTKLSDMSKAEYSDIHLSDEKQVKSPKWYNKTWDKFRDSPRRSHNHSYEVVHNVNNIIVNINLLTQRKKRAAAVPLSVDWRTKGVIGPVRDQGLCGACWAFSTVGTMEAMAAMQTGKLETLSVQEVIDCAGLGNSGCAGGDICLLLDWLLLTNSAVETEKEYPLNLKQNVCQLKKTATGVKISSFTCDDMVGKEDKVLEAIATHGPVAVAVNALTWQNYLGGVIQFHCSGTPSELNHAVELVGYDLTKDVPYYIAKNSWGPEFGNGGYIHLAVGSNICGLANEVATVDVK